jgi:cytochrome c oxidase subunit 4
MSARLPSPRTYLLVWVALLALFGLTLGSAYLPIGIFNVMVNVGVSLIQALLVMVFLMHLRGASALLQVFSSIGFLWLLMLFVLGLSDYLTRLPIAAPW